MISRIDQPPNVPKAPTDPRKTDDSDTRQSLQRHDPEFYKKKDDDRDRPGFRDPYEDLADVSVPALKSFLMGLLDKIGGPLTPTSTPAHTEIHRTAASPQAAAAMSAYQTGARRGAVSAPPPPPPPPSTPADASALDHAVAGLDRATVLDLIRDLDRLYTQGISTIALEKGDGFLASIRAGIDRAKGI